MTWTFQRLPAGPSTFVYSILRNRAAAPWREVAAGLPRDAALRDLLTELIARGPFSHVFWECAPLTAATALLSSLKGLDDALGLDVDLIHLPRGVADLEAEDSHVTCPCSC